jgi:type IV pilus assembly protein PilY1
MESAPRTSLRPPWLLSLGGGLVVFLSVSLAKAQDPEPGEKEPNVLFLVDASGSMEYLTRTATGPDGNTFEPVCDPNANNNSQKSRWIELVEVLGGTIGQYRCEAVDRRSASFASDFALPGNVLPPDADYRTPYHRPMSGSCAVGPGTVTHANVFDFDRPNFRTRGTGTNCASSFIQAGDGLIDSYSSLVRFGIMTLDSLPNAGTGYVAAPSYAAAWPSGATGSFSYFYGASAKGRPVYCTVDRDMEVGVRNGAAPAWEGKMIAFGDPSAGSQPARHAQIKDVILSTRPFGASPIAGALTDAMTFFWKDDSPDPLNTSLKYGPKDDPYVLGDCREQHIILLTDGEPNLDLRPHCAAKVNPLGPPDPTDGKCPFGQPVQIIDGLKKGSYVDPNDSANTFSGSPVNTYVVGFASSTTKGGIDCETLSVGDITSPTGLCATNSGTDKTLQICCNLHEMAYYGGDDATIRKPLFADDQTSLRAGIDKILRSVVSGSGSGTQPVRSPGVGAADTSDAKAYRILTSYNNKEPGVPLWRGNIERLRWRCTNGVATEEPKSTDQGDDFNFNISKDQASLDARKFLTFTAEDGHSDRTLRPNLSGPNDGLGALSGAAALGNGKNISIAIPFEAIAGGKTNANDIGACSDLAAGDKTTCRSRILDWAFGYEPDADGKNDRCASPGGASCSVIGDVLHSTPIIVDRPTASVADETYEVFTGQNSGRPMMAYVSSNDGQLHGFMVSPNRAEDVLAAPNGNNEKFSFIPPAVLPLLSSQYPSSRLKLLDGIAVSQDVVAVSATGASPGTYPYRLERTLGNAQAADNTWRTILVQSLGEAGSGYFALDITDVNPSSVGGPRFLWQITTDAAATPTPIFGQGGTPLITTLSINEAGIRKEVAVAVLPGGDAPETSGSCARLSSTGDWSHIPATYTPRSRARCYPADSRARSVTIVRLDSGEILRTFRATAASAGGIAPSRVATGVLAPIDAPITGVPAAYPDGTGAIADRVFVGDRDGTMYKIDLSQPDPTLWKMTLFFDALGANPAKASRPDEISQPIRTRPALSIDDKNQVVVAFATGDQTTTPTKELQYVWSLTESVNAGGSGFEARPNWYRPFEKGERVLGPLRLFGGVLYFATYTPPDSTNAGAVACQRGTAAIYGLHYLRAKPDISQGGADALRGEGADISTDRILAAELGLGDGTVIFGVNVEYAPQCYDVSEGASALVKGAKALVKGSTAPKVQLVFQVTTPKASAPGSGLNFATNFQTVALAPPKIVSTIESWAAILE